MTVHGKTFRVFISSTFDDMAAERNALQQCVFPQLQKLCADHACSFQAIDLRWGVSQEAGLAQRTISICLEEIERCQRVTPRPNFLVMLGNRYGWQPLPEEIVAEDFSRLRAEVDDPVDRALLDHWYLEDRNAASTVRYLRPRHLDLPQNVDYERENAIRDSEEAVWHQTETSLRRTLKQAAERLAARSIPPGYDIASAVEREVHFGALRVADAAQHVVCVFREWDNPTESNGVFDESDPEDRRRLVDLKVRLTGHLSKDNVLLLRARNTGGSVTTDYLDELCRGVLKRLSRIIRQQITQLQAIDELQAERLEHKRFADELIPPDNLVGREEELTKIADHIAACNVVVVTAEPGMGKSALIAEVSRQMGRRFPGTQFILRHVGATAASSNLRSLLFGLTRETAAAYDDPRPVPRDLFALLHEWQARLSLARPDKPLVVLLDSADATTENYEVELLSWLPATLPPYVALVISVSEPSSEAICARITNARFIQLGRLSREQAGAILDRRLAAKGRRLQHDQRELVLSRFDFHGSPLFLSLAAEQAACWRSHETPNLGDTPRQLAQEFLANLEHPANHGAMFVRRSLSYLACSRYGLSEDELLRVLSADADVIEYLRLRTARKWRNVIDRVPAAVWSRLFFDLRPFLTERTATDTTVLSFASAQLRQVVHEQYASDPAETCRLHATLAEFFRGEADPTGDGSWLGTSKRGFSEMAYHYREDSRLASSFSCPSAGALKLLTTDYRFRERQFLSLEDINPVIEIYHWTLELAIDCGTTANIVEAALRRFYLSGAVHRTLVHQLYSLAADKPNLADAVIDLLPTTSDRIIASVFCAWVEWNVSESRARARIKGLLDVREPFLLLEHVPLLVRLAITLTAQGLNEAAALAQFVPDCVQRDCYVNAWSHLTDARGTVARVMDESRPRRTVSSEECEFFGRASRFSQLYFSSGFLQQNRNPFSHVELMERRAVDEFGERGLSVVYALAAQDTLITDEELFRILVSRSFSSLKPYSQDHHCLTQLSIIKALTDVGRAEMAQQHRDRMVTALRAPFGLTKDPTALAFYQLLYDQLRSWFSQRELAIRPDVASLESASRKAAVSQGIDIEEVDHLLLKAGLAATFGSDDVAKRSSAEVLDRSPAGDNSTAATRMAASALIAAVGNDELPRRTPSAIDANDFNPQELIDSTGRIASCGVGATYAFAVSMRRRNAKTELRALLKSVCTHRADKASIDAITAQFPLESRLSATEVNDISDALERTEPVLGVNSGMGIYYFTAPWLRALLLGILLVCFGGIAHNAVASVAMIIWAGIIGGVADRYVWRRLRVWEYPERASRPVAEFGTYVSAGSVLFLERDVFGRIIQESYLACGIFVAVLAVAALVAWPRLAPWRLGYGLKKEERYWLIVATIATAFAAANVSTIFADRWNESFLAGVALGGAIIFGFGLNLLVKHIPVRRYYERKGIRSDFDNMFGELATYDRHPPLTESSPLVKSVVKADRQLTKRRYTAALISYNHVIDHADYSALSARQRASVYLNRGICHRKLRHHSDALTAFSAASTLNPTNFAPHYNAALVLAQDLQRYQESLVEFDLVVECDPLRVDAYSSRSNAKRALNDVAGAAADLILALRLDPTNPNALYNLGILRGTQGRSLEAANLFEKVLAYAPHDAETRFWYANALADCGRVDEAEQVAMKNPRVARKWIESKRHHRR